MPSSIRKLIYPLLLPCGAVLLAGAAIVRGADPAWLARPPAAQAPLLVAAMGAVLAWRLNRSRVVLALGLVFACHLVLRRFDSGPPGQFAFAAVAALLPLNLALISLLPERGLLTLRGLGRFILLSAQAVAGIWLYHRYGPLAQGWLEREWLGSGLLNGLPLTQLGMASSVAAAALLALRFLRHPTPLDSGFLWTLGAILLALLERGSTAAPAYFAIAELIMVTGLVEALHVLAFRDELTGLPARRALNEALAGSGGRYTLAMVDVDHFKRVNDRYGHDVGDQVLKMLASRLERVSGGGRAYRYGGEEFTLLFPRKGLEQALPHLEQLRRSIAAEPFRLRRFLRPRRKPRSPRPCGKQLRSLQITVSIGAAASGERHPTAAKVVKAADQALYRAKRNGRDQVRH